MVVSRGLAGFSRGREHLAVVSRAVVTVVRGQSFSDMVHVIFSRNAFLPKKNAGDTGFWEGTRVSGMPKHIKTHIKHIKTHIKQLETHIKHLETHIKHI